MMNQDRSLIHVARSEQDRVEYRILRLFTYPGLILDTFVTRFLW